MHKDIKNINKGTTNKKKVCLLWVTFLFQNNINFKYKVKTINYF